MNLQILDIFNNREIALGIYLGAILSVALFFSGFRKAVVPLIKVFFSWKIQVVILVALSYSTLVIYVLNFTPAWDFSLLKDSIIWFIGVGFIMLMQLNTANKEKNYFKDAFYDNLKLILLLEFILNFQSFSLIGELVLLPILTFLTLLVTVAGLKEEHKVVKKILDVVLAVIGFVLFGMAAVNTFNEINDFARWSTLQSFLLPIILTVLYLPFLYLTALYMTYETLFTRLGFFLTNKKDLTYAKRRCILKCHFKLEKLKSLSPMINVLYNDCTREDIDGAIN